MLQKFALPRMEALWKKKTDHTPYLTSLSTLWHIWCNPCRVLDASGNLMYLNTKRAFFPHWHKWPCWTVTFLHTVITFMDMNCRYNFFWFSGREELYSTTTTLPPRQLHKLDKTSYSCEGKDREKKDNVHETEADSGKKGSWVKSSVNKKTYRKTGRENRQEVLGGGCWSKSD